MKENILGVFIRRKLWIIALIILFLIFTIVMYELTFSFSGEPVGSKVIFPNAMAWDYHLNYTYKGYNYTVTKNIISPSLVGQKIDRQGWMGNIGAVFDMYSIKTELTYKQIAIKTKYGYLIANKGKKHSP